MSPSAPPAPNSPSLRLCWRISRRIALSLTWIASCLLPSLAQGEEADFLQDSSWSATSPLAPHAHFLNHAPGLRLDTPAEPGDYDWRGTPPEKPDWGGLGRDTTYFLGYQFAAIAVLYLAPESISGWDREQKENYSFEKWRDNVSQPVWDEDRWWINYVLHPYWGGAYYMQARGRGLDRTQSFFYSALLSTLWEYGAEALAEPVSAQDLVVTPVAGFLVGEYLLSPLRTYIQSKPGPLAWSDKALLFIADPLGVISAETDGLLGVKTALQWQPIGLQTPALAAMGGSTAGQTMPSYATAPAWGVQFRVDW